MLRYVMLSNSYIFICLLFVLTFAIEIEISRNHLGGEEKIRYLLARPRARAEAGVWLSLEHGDL